MRGSLITFVTIVLCASVPALLLGLVVASVPLTSSNLIPWSFAVFFLTLSALLGFIGLVMIRPSKELVRRRH